MLLTLRKTYLRKKGESLKTTESLRKPQAKQVQKKKTLFERHQKQAKRVQKKESKSGRSGKQSAESRLIKNTLLMFVQQL